VHNEFTAIIEKDWSGLSFVDTFTLGSEGVQNAEESSPVPSGATS